MKTLLLQKTMQWNNISVVEFRQPDGVQAIAGSVCLTNQLVPISFDIFFRKTIHQFESVLQSGTDATSYAVKTAMDV